MGLGFTTEYHQDLNPNYVKGSLTCLNEEQTRIAMFKRTPSVVNIELTNMCNARCTFCTNPSIKSKDRVFMDRYTFEKTINELKTYKGLLTLNWHKDGETLLHPDVLDYMKMARKALPKTWFHMNTNGINLGLRHRVMNYLDDVTVSIDAFGSDNYIKRKRTGAYGQVVENVLTIHEKYGKIRVKIMEGNDTSPEEVVDFLRYWNSYKVPTQVTGYHNWSGKVDVQITDEIKPVRFPCALLWYATAIGCDGSIYLCNVSDNSGIVGNVKNGEIKTQWISGARNKHLEGKWEPEVCGECAVWASGIDVRRFL